MNSHTSSCGHMIFVAKSSPERTQVPRRMTDRLTVRRLVNIYPGWPRTSSTAAPRKPSTTVSGHQEVNPRASSSSSARTTSSEPSRKRGREEVPPPPSAEPEKVPPPPPAEPEEVPPPPTTPTEVKPPPPEEVKPPRRKVVRQPVASVHASALSAQDASW
jgi:hypothetical protein